MAAVQDHGLYANQVLEERIAEMLESRVDVRGLMTIDNDLVGAPGMVKVINTYNYEGVVEKLAIGEGNTEIGKVSYESKQYEIELFQSRFAYNDEQAMIDPKVVEVGLKGIAADFVNDLQDKYYAELRKATLVNELEAGEAINYDAVVDCIGAMQAEHQLAEGITVESEDGLFILAGKDAIKDLRKDEGFKAAKQGEILFAGQIGSVCGIPVIRSNKVEDKEAFVATKEAVTLFNKKGMEAAQERKENERQNDVYMRTYLVVALTDATKVCKIVKA